MKIYTNKYIEHIITAIVLLPVSVSFILSQLTSDLKIYQGMSRMTDYFGVFPYNIDLVYESKPIANRIINYILYKFSSLFTTFGTLEYEMVIKLAALICVLLISYYFAKKFDIKYLFLFITLSFITTLNFIALQSEWYASLLSILAISLLLSDKPSNQYLSGAIITIIFLCKGITIFLVIPIICMMYFLKPDWFSRLKYGLYGSVLFLLLIVFCGYFTHMIPDMLLSISIVRVGYHSAATTIQYILLNLISAFLFIPVFLVGTIGAGILYNWFMRARELKKVAVFLIMWMSSFFIVFIQNEFFIYHYAAFIIPSILTIILLSSKTAMKHALIVMLVVFILFSSILSPTMSSENNFWAHKKDIATRALEKLPDINEQESMLYLDSGDATYFFNVNSTCRYVQSLPFKRNTDTWNMTGLFQYHENYKCIMDYKGKYIITDSTNWYIENTSDNRIVQNKISNEYEQRWSEGWNIFRRKL